MLCLPPTDRYRYSFNTHNRYQQMTTTEESLTIVGGLTPDEIADEWEGDYEERIDKLKADTNGATIEQRIEKAAEWAIWHLHEIDCIPASVMRECVDHVSTDLPCDWERQQFMCDEISRIVDLEVDRERERRVLADKIRSADMLQARDRELLSLPADDELTVDQIEAATGAAEAAAGLAKNGKPFPRFRNAADRLLLLLRVTEAELIEVGLA
jgi:hypothetical protein